MLLKVVEIRDGFDPFTEDGLCKTQGGGAIDPIEAFRTHWNLDGTLLVMKKLDRTTLASVLFAFAFWNLVEFHVGRRDRLHIHWALLIFSLPIDYIFLVSGKKTRQEVRLRLLCHKDRACLKLAAEIGLRCFGTAIATIQEEFWIESPYSSIFYNFSGRTLGPLELENFRCCAQGRALRDAALRWYAIVIALIQIPRANGKESSIGLLEEDMGVLTQIRGHSLV